MAIKSRKDMNAYAKKLEGATKGFGKVKAAKYGQEAKSRLGKFVGARKGL